PPRLALSRHGQDRYRSRQARRAEPVGRRSAQARRQHGGAARYVDRWELKLRVHELTISYGGEPVLERASLVVARGQFVSLVGPSGSGKSSLLRAAIGLQQPLAGAVEPEGAPPHIRMLFPDDAPLPSPPSRHNLPPRVP